MVPLESRLENKIYSLYVLEEILKPEGFVIGSNWDYDKGYFDLKMDDQGTYYFLRIPFYAVQGSLDFPGVTVRLEKPFLLGHQYQSGYDSKGSAGLVQDTFNQFQAPTDPDTEIPEEYIDSGKALMKKVEDLVIPRD
ncbi:MULTISPECIES: YugN-like family protein [Virgibacillus]|uniref:YugN-like family protein n=2 Tax=Virgibacillus TaxID=84406 RepID=A0A024QAH2_9BACI|nr:MULTISPECIES: YugN-like family protein [Virgibacillus]EQB37272.1 hypothetical protein M948_01685 [Virgibacillus sp. CM-4]GGJ62746.1 hypothetical protein GCM10007111_26060 [Virgibacillus kapii]CDQ39230.1 YugN-like family protein [Virgibacillus massiliensis]